jgi:hypothetical protein
MTLPVGAAEGCDLLTFLSLTTDQKIAAFGSSYRDIFYVHNLIVNPHTKPKN